MSQKSMEAVKGACAGVWDIKVLPWTQARFFFFFALFAHTAESLPGLPDPGKQQDFGEAVPLPSFPMVTRGAVPALLQPPWPTSARMLVLLSPGFTGKRGFARGKSILYPSQAACHLWSDTRRAQSPVCFSQGHGRARDAPRAPHVLGTSCLCEQKERWQTSRLKRNPTSIINEGVPMEKNIVLISLLDVSKALVIAVSEFQIVCFSLSESRWIFCWFSVTHCHPLIFLAALCPLSCSVLCFILALASCILLYIADIISLYLVNYCPWFIFLPSFLSALGFQVFFDLVLHLHCWHLDHFLLASNTFILPSVFFLFSFHQILSLSPCSFFLTTLSSCFFTLFPLCSQPAHHLGVPDLGWDHQNHQPKVPQRFLGTFGPCQAGQLWPREGSGGWGWWVALGGPDTAPDSRYRLVFHWVLICHC